MSSDLPIGEPVDPTSALLPSSTPMVGKDVALVPVDPVAHVAGLFAAAHGDPEREAVWTYMAYGPFDHERAMADWLGGCADSHDPRFYTVLERRTDRPVGVVSYLNVDAAMRHIELGHIWYGPDAQHTRVNTETVSLLLARAFEELGNRRVEWKCDALNARSRAAALRLGFSFEGVFRQHMIVKGRNRDTAWFSMLDHEWPARKINLRRWLDAVPGTVSLRALNAVP